MGKEDRGYPAHAVLQHREEQSGRGRCMRVADSNSCEALACLCLIYVSKNRASPRKQQTFKHSPRRQQPRYRARKRLQRILPPKISSYPSPLTQSSKTHINLISIPPQSPISKKPSPEHPQPHSLLKRGRPTVDNPPSRYADTPRARTHSVRFAHSSASWLVPGFF